MAPAIMAILAAVAIALWLATTPGTSNLGSGTPIASIVEPPWTPAEIEAIAEGVSSRQGLFEAVRAKDWTASRGFVPPGENAIELTFVRPGNDRRGGAVFGWPVAWWSRTEHARWDDAVARTGLRPLTTDSTAAPVTDPYRGIRPGMGVEPRPLWWWQDGTLWHWPAVESTGGVLRWSGLRVTGILASLGLIALCWAVTSLLVWVIDVWRTRRRRAPVGPWPARIVAVAAGVTMVAMAVAKQSSYDTLSTAASSALRGGPPRLALGRQAPGAKLGVAAFDEHRNDPDRDQWLAAAMLESMPDAPEPGSLLAARFELGSRMVGTSTIYNDRIRVLTVTVATYTKPDPDDPWATRPSSEPVAVPPGTRWQFDAPFLRVFRPSREADNQATNLTIDIAMLGTLALIVAGIWFVPFTIARFAWTIVVRRRRRTNRCVACGHGLGAPEA